MRLHRKAVHTVTDARRPMSEDIRYRQNRYLIHMGIRTACIILAVAVPMPLSLRIVMIFGAIALPYFAVVLANGGREPDRTSDLASSAPEERGPREATTRRREIGS